MAKYKITYNEGDHINKTTEVEANSLHDALVIFHVTNQNADFTSAEEVEE